jgi:DHA3 family macrolide efflux protein-like MFS transporter
MVAKSWKKNVSLFIGGQFISLFGTMLTQYTVIWYVTMQTKSGSMMALLSIASGIPMFLASPLGGVWADKFNRKKLINLVDGLIALVTTLVIIYFFLNSALVNALTMAVLLVCMAARGFGQGIQSPAVNAVVAQITPEQHLTKVNGFQQSMQATTMFASPLVAAGLLAVAPVQYLMMVDVVTAFIGISILQFLVHVPTLDSMARKRKEGASFFADFKEGMKYVRAHKRDDSGISYASFNDCFWPSGRLCEY